MLAGFTSRWMMFFSFKTFEAIGLILRVGQKACVDASLEVGQVTAEVSVKGTTVAQVETQSSELSGVEFESRPAATPECRLRLRPADLHEHRAGPHSVRRLADFRDHYFSDRNAIQRSRWSVERRRRKRHRNRILPRPDWQSQCSTQPDFQSCRCIWAAVVQSRAFAAPQGLSLGTVGRNSLNNPQRTNLDMGLFKHFAFTEARAIESRAEGYHVFNHMQWSGVNGETSCFGDERQFLGERSELLRQQRLPAPGRRA